jgi:prolyl oligopeptidase
MSACRRALLVGAWLMLAVPVAAQTMPSPTYPETRREAVVDVLFGSHVADPYRWLEQDVRSSPDVADWVRRENDFTRAYIEALPQRAWFERRIRALLDYERFGLPVKAGRRYFYTRNSGLQN